MLLFVLLAVWQVNPVGHSSTLGRWVQHSPLDSSHTAKPCCLQMPMKQMPAHQHRQHKLLQRLAALGLLVGRPVAASCSPWVAPQCGAALSCRRLPRSGLQRSNSNNSSSSRRSNLCGSNSRAWTGCGCHGVSCHIRSRTRWDLHCLKLRCGCSGSCCQWSTLPHCYRYWPDLLVMACLLNSSANKLLFCLKNQFAA